MYFKLIKKIINALGYKLIEKNFIKNERLIKEKTFFKLEKFLENLFLSHNINTIIQIGANDGVRFDSLNKEIKKHLPKVILVEPIKSNFEELKINYNNSQKNIFFENSAISVENEINYLYKVKESALNKYDEHIIGITSFNKSHLIKHGVKKRDIVIEKISPISITNLLNKYKISQFDLLFIDAEGYDGKILNDFLDKCKIRPFIIFEYIHLEHSILQKVLTNLTEKKYLFFRIDENVISFPIEKKLNSIF
ncbi:FkbM family methyltransferase [Candidatus Pelagibacter sp.]|nr:FkbM family methyltransferase [Candidatus Pelagibacter sp.]